MLLLLLLCVRVRTAQQPACSQTALCCVRAVAPVLAPPLIIAPISAHPRSSLPLPWPTQESQSGEDDAGAADADDAGAADADARTVMAADAVAPAAAATAMPAAALAVAAAASPRRSGRTTSALPSSQSSSPAATARLQQRAELRSIMQDELVAPAECQTWAQWLEWRTRQLRINKLYSPHSTSVQRHAENLKAEVDEVLLRGSECQTCRMPCVPSTKAFFQWAHRLGHARSGEGARRISAIIENKSVKDLREEFPKVWLQCMNCHDQFPNWDGTLPRMHSSSTASTATAAAAASTPSPSRLQLRAGLSRTAVHLHQQQSRST